MKFFFVTVLLVGKKTVIRVAHELTLHDNLIQFDSLTSPIEIIVD